MFVGLTCKLLDFAERLCTGLLMADYNYEFSVVSQKHSLNFVNEKTK